MSAFEGAVGADELLDEVRMRRARRDREQRALNLAMARARDHGVPVERIASAGDVTRQTAYRWIAAASGASTSIEIEPAVIRALHVLGQVTSDHIAQQLFSRARRGLPMEARILGLRLGLSNLPAGWTQIASSEEKAIVSDAVEAVGFAERYHGRTGAWPERTPTPEDHQNQQTSDESDSEA